MTRRNFSVVWLVLGTASYVWLVRPVGWLWGIPLFTLALEDLRCGNVIWLLALSSPVGLHRGAAWTVPPFIKITPAVGVLWLVPRRQWRELAWFVAATVAVPALSWSTVPDLWRAWFGFLGSHHGSWAAARTVLAGAMVVLASHRDKAWGMPFVMIVASPVFAIYGFAFFCALPRQLSDDTIARARAPFGGFRATVRRALDLA